MRATSGGGGDRSKAGFGSRRSATLAKVSVSLLALLTSACGSTDGNDSAAEENSGSLPSRVADEQENSEDLTVDESPSGVVITGSAGAADLSGYSFSLSFDLSVSSATVNLADAPPGEAFIVPAVDGSMTVTNTTSDRNASYVATHVNVRLMWTAPEFQDTFGSDPDACGFAFRGETYCMGPAIKFDLRDLGERLALAPDESSNLEPSQEPILYSLEKFDEAVAEGIAKLTGTEPPSLIAIEEVNGRLVEACQTEAFYKPVAILDGDGHELTNEPEHTAFVPDCSEA